MAELCILAIFQVKLLKWHSGKEATCQSRRRGFDPWVRKIPWRGKWQSTPMFLPRKSHGQRILMGYSPWGCKELDMTEHTHMYLSNKALRFYMLTHFKKNDHFKRNFRFVQKGFL